MASHDQQKNRWGIILAVFLLAVFSVYIFSRSSCAGGLVPCTNDCNLCYLIVGLSNIFQYLTGTLLLATVVLGVVIAGLSFIISGTFPKALAFAKSAIESTAKGAILALIAWIIINGIMNIVGYKHPTGGKWYQFECSTGGTTCSSSNKTLQSIKIKCSKDTSSATASASTTGSSSTDSTGFYVALDTLSTDGSGKTQQLKAVGTYSCDGTTSEEDITSQVAWKASDETQVKVSKGLVEAVTSSSTSSTSSSSSTSTPYVEATYQGKSSNQAKVYVDSCPNTTVTEADTGNKFSFSENSLAIPRAQAQTTSSSGTTGSWNSNTSSNSTTGTGCTNCGQANTCSWVGGSRDTSPSYLFVIMRSNLNLSKDVCSHNDTTAWGTDTKTWTDFKTLAEKYAKGLDYIPSSNQKDFAVYATSKIATGTDYKDSNCPTAKHWTSYGYLQNGTGQGAFASTAQDAAFYCKTNGDPIMSTKTNAMTRENYSMTFAHEQIGHCFAGLMDEYGIYETDSNGTIEVNEFSMRYPDELNNLPGYNCTADSKCTKWGSKNEICKRGCHYTLNYYRSSENSLMNDSWTATSFNAVNQYIIKEMANSLRETTANLSTLKETLILNP